MPRYYDIDKLKALIEAKADTLTQGKELLYHIAGWLNLLPAADVAPKSEVLNEIEALEKKVGQIYNHYVFEDTDYADDDVAIEAVMNALTEVLNELAELKNKYTEGEG